MFELIFSGVVCGIILLLSSLLGRAVDVSHVHGRDICGLVDGPLADRWRIIQKLIIAL